MSAPLSFGIEVEFLIAYVSNPYDSKPYPEEMRQVCFPEPEGIHPYTAKWTHQKQVIDSIYKTLSDAGFPVDPDFIESGDVSVWEVTSDASIQHPGIDSAYYYHDIEVRSPAFWTSTEAISEVEAVIKLLASKYLIHVNNSTGIHVHVGQGLIQQGFELPTVQRIAAFLWAFEPQLRTLHSTERYKDTQWFSSIRETSYCTESYQEYYDRRRPTVQEGSSFFLLRRDIDSVVRTIASSNGARFAEYNFQNLHEKERQTIEFRTEQSSFDPRRIRNWIRTVTGLIKWIRDAKHAEFSALLDVTNFEKWSIHNNDSDFEREKEFGPILADGKFTAVHLLNYCKLYEQALYYSDKLHRHPGGRKIKSIRGLNSDVVWGHQLETDPASDEFEEGELLRKVYEFRGKEADQEESELVISKPTFSYAG